MFGKKLKKEKKAAKEHQSIEPSKPLVVQSKTETAINFFISKALVSIPKFQSKKQDKNKYISKKDESVGHNLSSPSSSSPSYMSTASLIPYSTRRGSKSLNEIDIGEG